MVLALGCARVVPPGGGPEDREPPVFLECRPSPGVVDTLPLHMLLSFDENLETHSSLPLLFPDPGHSIRYRGAEIEVTLKHTPETSTLTLLFPPGISDRRGNRTAFPLNLAWTTADTTLTGNADFMVTMQGGGTASPSTLVRLFHLPDSLNPVRGAYPDSSGHASFPWLSGGNYRALAFEDRDGSGTWEDQTEPGILKDFGLEPGQSVSLNLVMAVVDTVGPRISSVEALDAYHVLVVWNEELHRDPPDSGLIGIHGPDGSRVRVLSTSIMPGRTQGRLLVYTEKMPDTLLTFNASGIMDLMGNPSKPDSLTFWSTDSLPREEFRVVSAFPAEGLTGVDPAGPYSITLNAWVPLDSLSSRYSITRVTDGEEVQGTMESRDGASFIFTPDNHLSGQMQYRVDLSQGLTTLWGDSLPKQSWPFSTGWSTLPGEISGRLTGTSRAITLVLTPAGGEGESRIEVMEPGDYLLQDVPAGRYTLAGFADTNGNGVWNPGEPYGAWPGVLEVFPGLLTGEVNIAILP